MLGFFASFVDWINWDRFGELTFWQKSKVIIRLMWAILMFWVVIFPILLVVGLTSLVQKAIEKTLGAIIWLVTHDRYLSAVCDSVIDN